MIAVDTNILIYAHRPDSPWHNQAAARVRQLAEGVEVWAIPWPCVHEFLAIVTHPKIFVPPTPLGEAIEQVNCWLESPSLQIIGELSDHWTVLSSMLLQAHIQGPRVHDARVAAIATAHRVSTLWTADRDFSRFGGLNVVNPLISDE